MLFRKSDCSLACFFVSISHLSEPEEEGGHEHMAQLVFLSL